jgi:hypothetical protein
MTIFRSGDVPMAIRCHEIMTVGMGQTNGWWIWRQSIKLFVEWVRSFVFSFPFTPRPAFPFFFPLPLLFTIIARNRRRWWRHPVVITGRRYVMSISRTLRVPTCGGSNWFRKHSFSRRVRIKGLWIRLFLWVDALPVRSLVVMIRTGFRREPRRRSNRLVYKPRSSREVL